jgi:signal transduction histidine kinase
VLNDADVSAPRWKLGWLDPTAEICRVHHRPLETVPASVFRPSSHFAAALRAINRYRDMRKFTIDAVRNVSNSIAHDLRTPLAELRTRLEVLALARLSPEESVIEIEVAVADVDRVIAIFNASLRLSEIDAGVRGSGFVSADVGAIVFEAAEFYQPVAELRGVSLSLACDGDLTAEVDRLLRLWLSVK